MLGSPVLAIVLTCTAITVPTSANAENAMIAAVRLALQKENPKISRVGVLGMRAYFAEGPHVVIGWGIRADGVFEGDFRDELFGIFVFDPSLTKIERTLAVIPTPRWLDYQMWVADITSTTVTIRGRGGDYGDGPMKRTFRLR